MQNKATLNKTQHRTVIYTKEEDLIPSLFFTKEPSINIQIKFMCENGLVNLSLDAFRRSTFLLIKIISLTSAVPFMNRP